MKFSKFFYMTAAAAVALMFAACEPDPPAPTMPSQEGSGETDGYVLVWEDLFDGTELDENNWTIEVNGDGGGNNELQYYRRENISIETDESTFRRCLVITAKKESYGGKSITSGRLKTQNKVYYQYGKFEAMIRLPKTYKGLWPAFWSMGNDYDKVGWPACGEFDILEMGHSDGFQVEEKAEKYLNGAFHWGPDWQNHYSYSYSKIYQYSLQDDEFHLFTLIWDKNAASCYIDLDKFPDAEPYYTIDISEIDENDSSTAGNYMHKPYFLILNLAVGGKFPGIFDADGITALNEENNYEASMWVDYVRIYQKAE